MSEAPQPNVPEAQEHKTDNPLEYPKEYFDAQVVFAMRWAELSGEPLAESLARRTVIAKRFAGPTSTDAWREITNASLTAVDHEQLSGLVYSAYIDHPEISRYHTPEHPSSSFFGYEFRPNNPYGFQPGANTIKIHFHSAKRGAGPSPLARDLLSQRQEDARKVVAEALALHPEANEIMGASWLYNLQSYRDSFPQPFVSQLAQLAPAELSQEFPDALPNMALTGNSVWGQFIDSQGWTSHERYNAFLAAINAANTYADLIRAFPLRPLVAHCTPQEFLG